MARVALPQSKVRARRKKQRIIVASVIGVALLLLFAGFVWLTHASFMRVKTVEVSGETTLQKSQLSDIVLADIDGSYWHLFPKDNIFLYPKYQTEAEILKQIPTVAKVSIHAKNFTTLGVEVTERTRKALWCGESVASASACFWLDERGLAYAGASDLSLSVDTTADSYKRYYGSLTGDFPQQFLTPDQFQALSALVDAIVQNQQSNGIQSIEVVNNASVRATFENKFTLLFSLSSAGADVYQRFVLALGSDAFAGHQLSDFEYLDLRFGDKLYYKLRSGAVVEKAKAQ